MMRTFYCPLFVMAGLLIVPVSGFSQVLVAPPLQGQPAAEETRSPELTIYAAELPDPLLTYRLWPEPGQRENENPMPLVNRAVILSLQVPAESKKRFAERYQDLIEMPADELPVDEVRAVLAPYESALRELRRAENMMRIDYPLKLNEMSAPELVQTLLPEFQEMRDLARLISLRARLAIREERWRDMADDCRLGFRLAEVAGHSTDFLVGRLVGIAIASTMMDTIETAIQQPGCPNLYWALVSLPAEHLFETRESLEFESILITRIFSGNGALPAEPIGSALAREKFREIVEQANHALFDSSLPARTEGAAGMLAGAYVVAMADPSRDLLASSTDWGQRAYELSPSEAVLRATVLQFTRARDRWVAWSLLPAEEWDEYEAEWRESLAFTSAGSDPLIGLVGMLTPAVDAARNAGRRAEQTRNWLITIEAIRTHAADKAELPISTDRLRPLPVWRDTIANGPFGYQRSTSTQATLTRAPRYPDDTETITRIILKGRE